MTVNDIVKRAEQRAADEGIDATRVDLLTAEQYDRLLDIIVDEVVGDDE